MAWVIRTYQTVKRFQASFPEQTPKPADTYVAVSAGGHSEVLKKVERGGAGGDQIFVSPRSSLPNGEPATAESVAELRYYWFRVCHDPTLKLAALGLAIGIAGIVIDAARDLGETWALITVSSFWMTASKVIGYVLKGLGLLVVFVAALLKEEG